MIHARKIISVLFFSFVVSAVALPVYRLAAQEPDQAPPTDQAPPEDQPQGQNPSATLADTLLAEKDPVIEALRESNPSTPADLIRAIELTLNMDRPDQAKIYLKKLIDLKPTKAQLAELQKQFGSALFLRLGRDPRLGEDGRRLVDFIFDAAQQSAKNTERIEALIKQLSSPEVGQRNQARMELRETLSNAIGPLLNVLADPARQDEHLVVARALYDLGDGVVPPLLTALDSSDPKLRYEVIRILEALGDRQAVAYLIGPAFAEQEDPQVRAAAQAALASIVGVPPNRRDGEIYLYRQIKDRLAGRMPMPVDYDNQVILWSWDPQQKVPVSRRVGLDYASAVLSAQLADDLYALEGKDEGVRLLYLATQLQAAKYEGGLDRPLPQEEGSPLATAAAFGPEENEKLLKFAIQKKLFPAACAAAEVLGTIGDESLLAGSQGRPSLLVETLTSGNRRLRFAGAAAIVRIDPKGPYPGSSHLIDTLAFLGGSGGSRRVLIGHPQASEAHKIAGFLHKFGFETDLVFNGRRLIARAVESPDYAMIVTSDSLGDPTIEEMVAQLHRDPRTAGLPIGVIASPGMLDADLFRAESDPLMVAAPMPATDEDAARLVGALLQCAGGDVASVPEQIAQADAALTWLNQLVSDPRYDLLRYEEDIIRALRNGPVSAKASELLGKIASPKAQQALVEEASVHVAPIELRQAAARGFANAVQRRGLLLTTQQILLQYDRYQQSEQLDQETQQVLSSILDVIEAASKRHEQPIPGAGEAPAPDQTPAESDQPKAEPDQPATEPPATEQPQAEPPTAEQPAVESSEPAGEEPAAEAETPAVEEPSAPNETP